MSVTTMKHLILYAVLLTVFLCGCGCATLASLILTGH